MKNKLRNVCVTGSGNGIGKAIAIMLNKHGFNVACADLSIEDAKNTLNEFENKDDKGIAVLTDITKLSEINKMVQKVVNNFGTLDIMINKDYDNVIDRSLDSSKFKSETGFNPQSWEKLIQTMYMNNL